MGHVTEVWLDGRMAKTCMPSSCTVLNFLTDRLEFYPYVALKDGY
jgi:hypothetical protein